jgi:hypothetical protein
MIVEELKSALEKCVTTLPNPFLTYKDFAAHFGFSESFPPAWANKNTLDPVADLLKKNSRVGLDLTFLIRSSTTGYPSVIDGKRYNANDVVQKQRAREVADQIIEKYALIAPNPY